MFISLIICKKIIANTSLADETTPEEVLMNNKKGFFAVLKQFSKSKFALVLVGTSLIIELLIAEAIKIEDGEEKDALVRLIANHMKKCYLTWNREVVTDESIFADLKTLSEGKIIIPEDMKLSESRDILSKGKKKRPQRKK